MNRWVKLLYANILSEHLWLYGGAELIDCGVEHIWKSRHIEAWIRLVDEGGNGVSYEM